MKIIVKISEFHQVVHEYEGYTMLAEPNDHGDLIVYRTHENMLGPQPVASYAAGHWISQTVAWDEEPK